MNILKYTPVLLSGFIVSISAVAFAESPIFHGSCNTFIGLNAGMDTTGSNNILIGDHTKTPTPKTNNFVNIDNKFCFDRKTGGKLKCPRRETVR